MPQRRRDVHFFTAVGEGESGDAVHAALRSVDPRVHVHAARRAEEHPRVVVGSLSDPRENADLDAYDPHRPRALVLTDGPRPVRIVRSEGTSWVEAPPAPPRVAGDYGAGDSFAAALTFFLAHGCPPEEACRLAGPCGAAVLSAMNPLDAQERLVAP